MDHDDAGDQPQYSHRKSLATQLVVSFCALPRPAGRLTLFVEHEGQVYRVIVERQRTIPAEETTP